MLDLKVKSRFLKENVLPRGSLRIVRNVKGKMGVGS